VQESQWLLKLHTYGLLNNSFQPPAEIRALRTYWRQRGEHVAGAATCIQRIQKALTQMNLQLANVISDISGLTGQAIVRAIIGGERDPRKLAQFRDPRIQASEEEIAKSLEGNWRPELLFVLQQELEMYDTYQRRIAECDSQLQKHLASLTDSVPPRPPEVEPEPKKRKRAKPAKNAPRFDLSRELQRITGVDLTRIDGIDVMIAQTLLSEVGGTRCCAAVRGMWSTAPPTHCGRLPTLLSAAAAILEPSTVAYAPSWVPRRLYHRHGPPPRPTCLSHAEVRSTIR